VTLKENNLREIEGGRILESQGVLVANKRSLLERPAQLLPVLHELLERLDAHLKAEQFYSGWCHIGVMLCCACCRMVLLVAHRCTVSCKMAQHLLSG
jgi:ATP phosphoribosyltransferase